MHSSARSKVCGHVAFFFIEQDLTGHCLVTGNVVRVAGAKDMKMFVDAEFVKSDGMISSAAT